MRFSAYDMSAKVILSVALTLSTALLDCQANAASTTQEKSMTVAKAAAKPEAKATPSAETKTTAKKNETKTTTAAPAAANAGSAKKSTKSKHVTSNAPRRMMVPPPPPEIPLISEPGAMERHLSTLGVPLDFMSKSDLESMRTRLLSNEERVRKETDDMKTAFEEKQDRVKRFEGLYKEGVVSRKELEAATRELTQAENDMRDQDEKLQDVQTDLVRVNKQLAAIEVRDKRSAALRSTKRH